MKKNKYIYIIKLFIKYISNNKERKDSETPLLYAYYYYNKNIVPYLTEYRAILKQIIIF